ncbi:MAG: hypothetical protein R6X34_07420 [Chloroflexota bacterium]
MTQLPPPRPSRRKRTLYILTPLVMLLLCCGLLNLLPRTPVSESSNSTTDISLTAVPTTAALSPPQATETAVPPTETPTATPIPLPVYPPTATITLLGPPNGSRVMAQDSITIYWTWMEPLTEDQYFGVYLQDESGESRVGRLEEANFGAGYRWQTAAQNLVDGSGDVQIIIKLETILSSTSLLTSEPRTLVILGSGG